MNIPKDSKQEKRVMKTHLWSIYILICCLLTGCFRYNRYFTAEAESTNNRHIEVLNASRQTFWAAIEVNNLECSPKDFQLVEPNSSYYKPGLPAKEKVTLVLRYFDESGPLVEKNDVIITRQTLEIDQRVVVIDDLKLHGFILQPGFIINKMSYAAEFSLDNGQGSDDEAGSIGILRRGQKVAIQHPPGIVSVKGTYVEGPYKGQSFRDWMLIDDDPNDSLFGDEVTGWVFGVDPDNHNNHPSSDR